jgi:hypothetical protein
VAGERQRPVAGALSASLSVIVARDRVLADG